MIEFIPAESERQFFYENGYLVVRNVLDEETVAGLIEAGDRLLESDRTDDRQTSANGLYDGFRNSITKEDAFLPLLTNPRILSLMVQILGPNLHAITSHLIYRQPDPSGTPTTHRLPGWHRDYYHTPRDLGHANLPRMLIKCGFYLTDLSAPQSGVTMVSPQSHLLKHTVEIPERQPDPENAVEPLLNPGDCLLFENRTFHAGAANITDRIRKVIMIGYGYRWLVPMDYRVQPQAFMDKLSEWERFLMGDELTDTDNFKPGGGRNPLSEWAEQNGFVYEPPI